MIQTIIIDNDTAEVKRLLRLLKTQFSHQLHIEGIFSGEKELLPVLDNIEPGLVFLSTSADGNFSLFNIIRDRKFEIVVTSDTDKYALDAFRHEALHYLLKPLAAETVKTAIDRMLRMRQGKPRNLVPQIDHLIGNIEQIKHITAPKKVIIPTLSGFELINVIDILFCQSKANYTNIYLKNKQKMLVAKTLLEFEKMLEPYNFIRIHHSHLVNLAYVKSYYKGKSGSVCLTDGTVLEISIRKKEAFFKALYLG